MEREPEATLGGADHLLEPYLCRAPYGMLASLLMPFERVIGQPTAMETLARALTRGQVHHAYRFEGPDGVGKELAAIAFAQALVCTGGVRLGCGACDSCHRAERKNEQDPKVPMHPDVVLIGRGVYPPELIGGKKEATEISVEQVRRVVLTRAAFAPHEGRAQVFIIRRAEELSISAASALLKTLEEPRPGTHFVLVSSQPELLLDTIRSRSLPIRFGPLADEALTAILTAHGVDSARIPGLCELAGGSADLALELCDPERSAAREEFVTGMLEAIDCPTMAPGVIIGESVERDRTWLEGSLRALGVQFVREARRHVASDPARAHLAARRHALCIDAIDAIDRNGQAGLVIAALVSSLRHGHQRRPGTPPPIVVTRR